MSTEKAKPNKEQPKNLPTTGYIRLAILISFVPFSKSTIWRKVKSGDFPKPIKLSSNITAWKAEDVRAWMDEMEQGEAA